MSRITEILGAILLGVLAYFCYDYYHRGQEIEQLKQANVSAVANEAAAKVHEPLVVAATKKKEQAHAKLEVAAKEHPDAAGMVVPDDLADLLRAPAKPAK